MDAYINQTIPLQYYELEGPIPIIIGDSGITASGNERGDFVKVRSRYKVSCKKLKYDEWSPIWNHLMTIMFGETTFWCEDFGGTAETNGKYVKITWDNPKLVQFGRGDWERSGRDLTLTITETR